MKCCKRIEYRYRARLSMVFSLRVTTRKTLPRMQATIMSDSISLAHALVHTHTWCWLYDKASGITKQFCRMWKTIFGIIVCVSIMVFTILRDYRIHTSTPCTILIYAKDVPGETEIERGRKKRRIESNLLAPFRRGYMCGWQFQCVSTRSSAFIHISIGPNVP